MKKILYVILHGSIYKNRYFNIIDSWGHNKELLFYSDYEDTEKNIIKVSNRNDYHSNEEKHINVIKHIYNILLDSYEWFFFCDDDTFVDTKKLENMLENMNKKFVHGSVINCWNTDKTLHYCSGGAGYLIHKDIINNIGGKIRTLNTGYSDVSLGIILRENNIKTQNWDFFNSQSPSFYNFKYEEIKNKITFHYIKTKNEMINLLQINKNEIF